jgi:hypothetical protein
MNAPGIASAMTRAVGCQVRYMTLGRISPGSRLGDSFRTGSEGLPCADLGTMPVFRGLRVLAPV